MTVFVHELVHPFLVTLSVKVKAPETPAAIATELPLVDPIIVPDPLILHACVSVPPPGAIVDVNTFPVLPPHTSLAPDIEHVGIGFTVTVIVAERWQPVPSVDVPVTVYVVVVVGLATTVTPLVVFKPVAGLQVYVYDAAEEAVKVVLPPTHRTAEGVLIFMSPSPCEGRSRCVVDIRVCGYTHPPEII